MSHPMTLFQLFKTIVTPPPQQKESVVLYLLESITNENVSLSGTLSGVLSMFYLF